MGFIRRPRADARQADGLRRGIFVDGKIIQSRQCRHIIYRRNRDRESSRCGVICHLTVIDSYSDRGGTACIGDGREAQAARGVRTGVTHRRIRDQTRIRGSRRDCQRVSFIGRAGADAGQVDELCRGIFRRCNVD